MNDVSHRQEGLYLFIISYALRLHLPGVVIEPQAGIAMLLYPCLISSFLESRNFGSLLCVVPMCYKLYDNC